MQNLSWTCLVAVVEINFLYWNPLALSLPLSMTGRWKIDFEKNEAGHFCALLFFNILWHHDNSKHHRSHFIVGSEFDYRWFDVNWDYHTVTKIEGDKRSQVNVRKSFSSLQLFFFLILFPNQKPLYMGSLSLSDKRVYIENFPATW